MGNPKVRRMPWLCCGDFNEILFNHEKEGGPPRAERCMEKFRQALEDCELQDLGFVGDAFTWKNHHHDANRYTKKDLIEQWLMLRGDLGTLW